MFGINLQLPRFNKKEDPKKEDPRNNKSFDLRKHSITPSTRSTKAHKSPVPPQLVGAKKFGEFYIKQEKNNSWSIINPDSNQITVKNLKYTKVDNETKIQFTLPNIPTTISMRPNGQLKFDQGGNNNFWNGNLVKITDPKSKQKLVGIQTMYNGAIVSTDPPTKNEVFYLQTTKNQKLSGPIYGTLATVPYNNRLGVLSGDIFTTQDEQGGLKSISLRRNKLKVADPSRLTKSEANKIITIETTPEYVEGDEVLLSTESKQELIQGKPIGLGYIFQSFRNGWAIGAQTGSEKLAQVSAPINNPETFIERCSNLAHVIGKYLSVYPRSSLGPQATMPTTVGNKAFFPAIISAPPFTSNLARIMDTVVIPAESKKFAGFKQATCIKTGSVNLGIEPVIRYFLIDYPSISIPGFFVGPISVAIEDHAAEVPQETTTLQRAQMAYNLFSDDNKGESKIEPITPVFW